MVTSFVSIRNGRERRGGHHFFQPTWKDLHGAEAVTALAGAAELSLAVSHFACQLEQVPKTNAAAGCNAKEKSGGEDLLAESS